MDILEQVAEIRAEEALERAAKAFLTSTDFSVAKIASLLDVPVSLVRRVKYALSKENTKSRR